MKHISALKDVGIGKSCLLVGNGPSAQMLEAMDIPANLCVIGMNQTPMKCDMVIYYDADMAIHFDALSESPTEHLIGFKTQNGKIDNTSRHCTHSYHERDMVMGDTGFHALQFADKVFNFNTIYLVGYDYTTSEKTYHFYERESDAEKMNRFKIWSIGHVLEKYKMLDWDSDIFNMNTKSALKAFPYKSI